MILMELQEQDSVLIIQTYNQLSRETENKDFHRRRFLFKGFLCNISALKQNYKNHED